MSEINIQCRADIESEILMRLVAAKAVDTKAAFFDSNKLSLILYTSQIEISPARILIRRAAMK